MKKLLIILCLLFLMIDLADEGHVYVIKLVAPQSSSSLVAAEQPAPGNKGKAFTCKTNLKAPLLPALLLKISAPPHLQVLATRIPHPGELVLSSHLCSSGGLPWLS